MKILKYDVRLETFFRRGVPNVEDNWGVYTITGFQGSGKTYLATFLVKNMLNDYDVITNIKSLKLPKKEVKYFTKIEEITSNTETNKLFIIDEISKRYTKNSPQDTSFYSWLQQSRKRGRIVILITQEWKEVPMWLRRPVRFMYTTKRLGFLPIFVTSIGDGLNTKFNTETNEWECPVISYLVYKRNKNIAQLYDTFEPINDL